MWVAAALRRERSMLFICWLLVGDGEVARDDFLPDGVDAGVECLLVGE